MRTSETSSSGSNTDSTSNTASNAASGGSSVGVIAAIVGAVLAVVLIVVVVAVIRSRRTPAVMLEDGVSTPEFANPLYTGKPMSPDSVSSPYEPVIEE